MADNTQLFFDEVNGKYIDFDGYYGAQCMDLANKYVVECLGLPRLPVGNAWTQWYNYQSQHYTRVVNAPSAIPKKGDILIWKKVWFYLPQGHIAIYDRGDINSFISMDQNWPLRSPAHYQKHNYRFLQGWLRRK